MANVSGAVQIETGIKHGLSIPFQSVAGRTIDRRWDTTGHNGYFTNLKEIVHFYNTRDVLPRCKPHDAGEGTTCWPAPESTDNMNTSKVGNLSLSDAEEDT